ncbi:hypothetical protein CBS9595_000496 [Malassezia furfur]|nr:hypothetical protein CBS9595_000496 [Malassezia furfur]
MDEDPARLFFPEGEEVDLYAVLGLSADDKPSHEAIKKAYRKRALQCHPDKAALRGKAEAEEASRTFQQVGFAYSILSDEKKRKRYDTTGSTSDSVFEDGNINWEEYFQTLWDGEVNAETLEEFRKKYQGSDEERKDILQAYRDAKGRLERIFATVPCSNILEDETRFMRIVQEAIDAKELPKTKAWTSLQSDEGKRQRKQLKARAKREADEAEAYAKELGVYDTIYQKDKPKKDKPKKDAPQSTEDDDLDALRAALQSKAGKRESAFDAMIQRLEREQTATPPNKRARKARK